MKRERNRSGDAAMLGRKSVKSLDGFLVTKNDGNLPALGPELSLTLRACFRRVLEFQSNLSVALGALDKAGLKPFCSLDDFALVVGRQFLLLVAKAFDVIAGVQERGSGSPFSVLLVLCGESHFVLQYGRIPSMCLPYIVTSDVSTGIYA